MGIRPHTSQEPCAPARLSNSYNINKSINPIIMKKSLLMKTMLLLCALITGSTSAWADDVILSLDCETPAPTGTTSTALSAAADVAVFLNSAAGLSSAENKITCSAKGGDVYKGKGSGGGDIPQQCLKVGKASGGGSFTFTIPTTYDNVNLVEITCYGWKTTSSISVNGGTAQSFTTAQVETTKTFELTSATKTFAIAVTTSAVCITRIVLKKKTAAAVATPTFSPAAGAFTSAQNVTISCATDGAEIYYTLDGATPTGSSTKYTSAINVTETKTIKAIAIKGSDASAVATATYSIYPVAHAGTEAEPYTVADARNAIDANTGVSNVYATGIVSEIVTAYSSEHKNISFNISADGLTTSAQLQAYRCKKGDGGSDPDVADIQVGDVVIVKGNLVKYGSTYEFAQDNVLISLDHPVTPIIVATPTSLTGFTYGLGNGPSAAKTFSVEGSNLTANIILSLGAGSNYEMSLSENTGYTNELSLTPTAGTVDATDIYVRLKADLAINASYEGTVTLASTEATNKTVSLTGSVTSPNFTWDLSTDQTAAATTTAMNWIGTSAVMGVAKGSSSTDTNNYYPGTSGKNYSSTRFYSNSILTITPISGYTISSIVFEATSESYATVLKTSTWTNATASASEKVVTVTPTSGTAAVSATIGATCGFTSVKVYYTGTTGATETISLNALCTDGAKYYGTYSTSKAFVVPTDLTVSEISVISGQLLVEEYNAGAIVPANTGVMVSATTSGDHNVYVASGGTSVLGTDNMLQPSGDAGISAANMTAADTKFYRLTMHNGTQIGFWWGAAAGAAFDLAANKAYLAIPDGAMSARDYLWFVDDDVTSVDDVRSKMSDGRSEYFNLAGQRVAQPTKGLCIVNGKKYVIK